MFISCYITAHTPIFLHIFNDICKTLITEFWTFNWVLVDILLWPLWQSVLFSLLLLPSILNGHFIRPRSIKTSKKIGKVKDNCNIKNASILLKFHHFQNWQTYGRDHCATTIGPRAPSQLHAGAECHWWGPATAHFSIRSRNCRRRWYAFFVVKMIFWFGERRKENLSPTKFKFCTNLL